MSSQPTEPSQPASADEHAAAAGRPRRSAEPEAAETRPALPPDVIDFSAEARRLLEARGAASDRASGTAGASEDAARDELVERLRAELTAGGYRVDAAAIARALAEAEDGL